MRHIRLFALGVVSFAVALIAAFLSPGTWLNRAIATTMCTVFSFNSAMCTVDLARSSDRVVAATPPAMERTMFDGLGDLLVQRDPNEFGDDQPTTTPPVNNPQAPSFPQDPGPNQPLRRPDFDDSNSIKDATSGAISDVIRQANEKKCDYPNPVYAVYINGVNTTQKAYADDRRVIESLLSEIGIKSSPYLRQETYNPTGKIITLPDGSSIRPGDFIESFLQTVTSDRKWMTPSGKKLIDSVKNSITNFENQYEELNSKSSCDCKIPKPKYLFIGHSQGNFFVEDIVKQLDEKIQERTSILSTASFTNYAEINKNKVRFDFLLRPDDFPAFFIRYRKEVSNRLNRATEDSRVSVAVYEATTVALNAMGLIKIPGEPNLPPLLKENMRIPNLVGNDWENFLKLLDSHLIQNYLGKADSKYGVNSGSLSFPTKKDLAGMAIIQPAYKDAVQESHDKAVTKLKKLLNYEDQYYDKKQCKQPEKKIVARIDYLNFLGKCAGEGQKIKKYGAMNRVGNKVVCLVSDSPIGTNLTLLFEYNQKILDEMCFEKTRIPSVSASLVKPLYDYNCYAP